MPSENTLPGNADRYTVLANESADRLPAIVAACNTLGLEWFATPSKLNRLRVDIYIFFDKQGTRNYLAGLYAVDEEN